MRTLMAVAAAGLLLLPGCGKKLEFASRPDETRKTEDQEFLIDAIQANLAEIDAGRLAVTRTTSEDVRKFATHMVDDHSMANGEVSDLARKKSVHVPTTPSQEQLRNYSRIAGMTGAEFDRDYAGLMVRDHIKAVQLFEKAATGAAEADVREWAGKTLPMLKKHLQMARELIAKLTGATPN
jgi:putative membrane protein